MLHPALVEQPDRFVEVGSGGDAEAEVVEPHPERVEAVAGSRAGVVDGPQSDEHPLMGQDHPTLERIHERVVVLVVGRRRLADGDVEAEHLGVEGLRPLDVRDREAQMMDRTHGKVTRTSSTWERDEY